MINKRKIGTEYEKQAAAYLLQKGYEIILCNYRCRIGEIDIIARDKGCIVFVEVKYRTNSRLGYPEEAVDRKKQQKICRVADYYRISRKLPENQPFRFDVVVIMVKEITHYENAFAYR